MYLRKLQVDDAELLFRVKLNFSPIGIWEKKRIGCAGCSALADGDGGGVTKGFALWVLLQLTENFGLRPNQLSIVLKVTYTPQLLEWSFLWTLAEGSLPLQKLMNFPRVSEGEGKGGISNRKQLLQIYSHWGLHMFAESPRFIQFCRGRLS